MRIIAYILLTAFINILWCKTNAQDTGSILWNPNVAMPDIAELQSIESVQFITIKDRQTESVRYNFLHGAALAFYKDKLYASFALNKAEENTASEEAHYCISDDLGQTWSESTAIDTGEKENLAISHGVFLSSPKKLWAFHGSFYGKMQDVHMRGYLFNEKKGTWEKKGVVAESGFWPMDEPQKMDNGNWIIGGVSVGKTSNIHGPNWSAVAISHGDNLLKWDVVKIKKSDEVGKMWGESSIIVKGNYITNISRYGEKKKALVAYSKDFGQTWSRQVESNLPMAASKPYCGKLSTGHIYLVSNTASDIEARHPLTISIGQPGETSFSSVFCIRNTELDSKNVESSPYAALSYPYAIEYEGKLYIGYSNDGGRGKNINNAELAVVPVSKLIRQSRAVLQNQALNSIPDTIFYKDVDEGHLQGMATDYQSALYWSCTSLFVKTDFQGNVIKSIKVPSHHGDLDYHEGKIYVAVNLGLFNEEEGQADSWVYVYNEVNLSLVEKYPVPEVIHGAGGLAIHGDRMMLVGGLPDNGKYDENFVYEYTMDFNFVKVHRLKSGYTHLGIQTASYHNGFWYFGCYGKGSKLLAPVVLKAKLYDDGLRLVTKFNKDFSFGMIGLNKDRWLISNNFLNNSARIIQFEN